MQIKLKMYTLWDIFVTIQRAGKWKSFAIIDALYTLAQCHY